MYQGNCKIGFFYGMNRTLRDSICYLYNDPAIYYPQLMLEDHKAEFEISYVAKTMVEAEAASVIDEKKDKTEAIGDQIFQLMSAVKSYKSREPNKKDSFKNKRDAIVLDPRLILKEQ